MKVLLYSGGMDSWLIDKAWRPDVRLYIDIEGDYSRQEMAHLPGDVKVVRFPLLGEFELPSKHIPMRNLYFLMVASNYGDDICLGATAGDGGRDKSIEFLDMAERFLRYLWDDKKASKEVSIEKRFCREYKSDLLDGYLASGGDVNEVRASTFSCYTPHEGKECLHCYPCFRKFALLYTRGCSYSREERERVWDYVRRRVLPTRDEGGYDGTYYTDRGRESVDLVRAVQMLGEEFG